MLFRSLLIIWLFQYANCCVKKTTSAATTTSSPAPTTATTTAAPTTTTTATTLAPTTSTTTATSPAVTTLKPMTDSNGCAVADNTDYSGSVLPGYPITVGSVAACSSACMAEPKCLVFVLNKASSACYLKQTASSPSTNPDTYSGACPSGFKYQYPGYYISTYDKFAVLPDIGQCYSLCKSINCNSFSYGNDSQCAISTRQLPVYSTISNRILYLNTDIVSKYKSFCSQTGSCTTTNGLLGASNLNTNYFLEVNISPPSVLVNSGNSYYWTVSGVADCCTFGYALCSNCWNTCKNPNVWKSYAQTNLLVGVYMGINCPTNGDVHFRFNMPPFYWS